MKRSNIVVDSIVRKSRIMPTSSIMSELKIGKNSALIKFLMYYLLSTIEETDYSTELSDNIEVLRVLKYINPNSESEFKIIEEYIKKIRELIQEKKILFANNKSLFDFFEILEEKIGSFLIETRFEMINVKDKIGKVPNVDDKNLRSIICDYIFKYRDYGHLSMIMGFYPNACNIKSNNKTIIIKILKNYFSKPNERDFLSKVITLFISNVNFSVTEEEKKEICDLCAKYSFVLKLKDLIFVKEIITTLGIKQEINAEEKLNLLKKRFGIEDLSGINFRMSYETFPVNMTDRSVLTIDCADTLIRDDAFSIEIKDDGSYELGLYITDVSSIKAGSPVDIYAFNHFSTIYTKDTWLPMIHEPLVYDFSLDKGLRRVMAFTFRFSSNFELIDCEIASALIKVRQNLSYADSLELLTIGGELYPTLRNALDLSEAIGDSLGTIDKYHHLKEIVRELVGSVNEIPEKYLDTPGNRIITTFAVFLNNYIATLFYKSGLPFIYRVNELESNDNIQVQLKKYHRDKAICDVLKSIQTLYKTSTFSSVNIGHKGLGLTAYTQATNPARLYPSLLIQRMLMDLFIYKIPADEYIKKYNNVEGYAKEFTALQQRNYNFTNEYNKLCRRLNLDKK